MAGDFDAAETQVEQLSRSLGSRDRLLVVDPGCRRAINDPRAETLVELAAREVARLKPIRAFADDKKTALSRELPVGARSGASGSATGHSDSAVGFALRMSLYAMNVAEVAGYCP